MATLEAALEATREAALEACMNIAWRINAPAFL